YHQAQRSGARELAAAGRIRFLYRVRPAVAGADNLGVLEPQRRLLFPATLLDFWNLRLRGHIELDGERAGAAACGTGDWDLNCAPALHASGRLDPVAGYDCERVAGQRGNQSCGGPSRLRLGGFDAENGIAALCRL